jgi:hypothetical protein
MRGIDSYGRDCAYLQNKVLPVHGTSTPWSFSRVKQRVQGLMAARRKDKTLSSSGWKRWMFKDGSKESTSTTIVTTLRSSSTGRVVPKNVRTAHKSFIEAVPLPKKAQLLTVTRSGRKVLTLFTAPKRPNETKTRFGRRLKPRII